MKGNHDRWLRRQGRVPQCHALCWPSVGDNELSCNGAILPTVCSEEEMGNDDLRGIDAEAVSTPPECKKESRGGWGEAHLDKQAN